MHFNAGTLNGEPLTYDVSAHGPVFATATIDGEPYALSRRRSTFGRDGLNLAALKDMTEGDASTPNKFFTVGEQVRVHLQLGVHVAQERRVLLVRPTARAPARARPPAADDRYRGLRVDRAI